MHRILTGKNKTITMTTFFKIASAFDMTIQDFMNDKIFLLHNLEID